MKASVFTRAAALRAPTLVAAYFMHIPWFLACDGLLRPHLSHLFSATSSGTSSLFPNGTSFKDNIPQVTRRTCEKKLAYQGAHPCGNTHNIMCLKALATTSRAADRAGSFRGSRANLFKCSHCEYTSRNEVSLAGHLQVVHAIPVYDSAAGYQCHFCQSSFSDYDQLMWHLQKHAGLDALECFLCNKRYSSKYHLERHIKTTHCRIDSIPCHLCSSKFSRRDTLVAHIRKNHMY
ncbi:hypothetical protein HPB50_026081 [Hyalomma asiaticum]|uniref:Uncharacterized protein n=1 Tax=Hyalomma asiaticum TaxID=266040 RepID=A0ACB7RK12_HYAAI|nr:hypothetical protein HPB50_026081 [Hyalomma asiaticum]